MTRQVRTLLLLIGISIFTGCYHSSDDDDFRSVPVTNNPNMIPMNTAMSG